MTAITTEKLKVEPKEVTPEERVSLEAIRRRMVAFGHEMEEYLNKVEANVEGYKFSVEKKGDGVEVEVEFKALIHPKKPIITP